MSSILHTDPVALAAAPAGEAGAADLPLLVIEPRHTWQTVDLGELWRARELLFFLTWRDIKVRYKQTFLGALWAVLQPVMETVIFTLIFAMAFGSFNGYPYLMAVYAGVLAWTFFNTGVSQAGNSLITNTNLLTKVYFPRLVIPVSAVVSGLVDFAVALGIMVVLMAWYRGRIHPGWGLLLLPLLVGALILATTGVGTLLAALNVSYRDFRYVIPFMLRIWMFATPVMYPASLLEAKHPRLRLLLELNPMAGLIEGFRFSLLGPSPDGRPFDWWGLAVSLVMTLGVIAAGTLSFRQMERRFADII